LKNKLEDELNRFPLYFPWDSKKIIRNQFDLFGPIDIDKMNSESDYKVNIDAKRFFYGTIA
jgi:hypothetical protein